MTYLDEEKVGLLSLHEAIDTTTTSGKLTFHLFGALAEFERNLIRERTQAPIHTAVFTHGHVDHAYGLSEFLVEGQDTPEVIGHEAMPARFERYEATAAHNRAVNARQFGGTVGADPGAE